MDELISGASLPNLSQATLREWVHVTDRRLQHLLDDNWQRVCFRYVLPHAPAGASCKATDIDFACAFGVSSRHMTEWRSGTSPKGQRDRIRHAVITFLDHYGVYPDDRQHTRLADSVPRRRRSARPSRCANCPTCHHRRDDDEEEDDW